MDPPQRTATGSVYAGADRALPVEIALCQGHTVVWLRLIDRTRIHHVLRINDDNEDGHSISMVHVRTLSMACS